MRLHTDARAIQKSMLMFNPLLIVLVAAVSFTACKEVHKDTDAPGRTQAPRDHSINKSNAYNDMFLDSANVEQFIAQQKLNDTLASAMRDFYNVRNYEYAWFASTGMIEQSFNFHSKYCTENDCDLFNKALEDRLDKLRAEGDTTVDAKDPITINTELQITQRFVAYALENNKNGDVTAAQLGTYVPAKKMPILARADSALQNNDANEQYAKSNSSYRALRSELARYTAIAKKGGWPTINEEPQNYTAGIRHATIKAVKTRLQMTGELAGTDTSDVFDAPLEAAVKAYQTSHGYKATGQLTPYIVKSMNVPALTRVEQLLINMQRMRWLSPPDGNLIVVNIPEFVLYVNNGKNTLFKMDVVVGAEGHNTTLFSGSLNQIVFSPYWNVPPSIVKKEILPAIAKDKDYLEKKDMEITDNSGGLPEIRQRPGPKNALGRVKFLFPNSFNIYMHDTPEKKYFERSIRGLSHGCIRLSDPVKMANYLLQDSKKWTPERIDSAMNSGEQQYVKLEKPVPVIITYYTSWVDESNTLHFADDIYGHDNEMAKKMFTNPQ